MEHRCIIAGFGGQGIISLGSLVTNAGMVDNKQVTFFPSYGIAMRGGMANCTIVVSDEAIRSPIVSAPDILMVMDEASYDCFQGKVAPGGWLFVNSSLIGRKSTRSDIRTVYVEATRIALENGDGRMANMVMLGAVIRLTGLVSLGAVEETISKITALRLQNLVDKNLHVMKLGFDEVK